MIQEQLFFEQEIIRIKEEYGTQYFSKSGFHAVLKDLSPHIERKYFTVLKIADDFGLYKKIKVITATDESTKVITIENLKHQFIDENGLDITVASSVFWAFLFGNGVTDIQTVINDASNQPTINIEDNKSIRTVSEKSLPFVEKKSNGDGEVVAGTKMKLISINLHKTSKENIRKFCKKIRLGEEGTNEILSDKECGFATFWLEISNLSLKLVALNRVNDKKVEFKTSEMKEKYSGKLYQFINYNFKDKVKSIKLDDKRFVQKNSRSINRSNNQKLSNSDLNEIKAYYSNVIGGLGSAVLRRDFEQRWQVFTQWYTKNQTSAFFEFGNWIKRALQVNSVYRVHLNVAKTLATSWKKKNKTVNVEAFEMAIGLCL